MKRNVLIVARFCALMNICGVQVPLNVMEDRLLGSVDVEESVKQVPTCLLRAARGHPAPKMNISWSDLGLCRVCCMYVHIRLPGNDQPSVS